MKTNQSRLEKRIQMATQSDVSVLVDGPTGAGKSTLAEKIHSKSSRRCGPFVAVDLAALHEGTLESELFGHEKGAFTGAVQSRVGRLQMAEGGTLFLDEIGELPLNLQARLLQFLNSKKLVKVGGNQTIQVDTRLICATHRDLAKLVKEGKFREDLFHRLRVLHLTLPGLADQKENFNETVQSVLSELSQKHQKAVMKITQEVAEILEAYSWPGNFRELRHVLEFALLSCDGESLKKSDLPEWMVEEVEVRDENFEFKGLTLLGKIETPLTLDYHGTLARFERDYLQKALERYRGRINRTAREIGLNKTTLIRRMRAFGLYSQLEI